MSEKCDFGLIGLAVMGENLALNVESRGYRIAVYNRTTEKVDESDRRPRGGQELRRLPLDRGAWSTVSSGRERSCCWSKPGPAVDDLDRTADSAAGAGRRDHRRRQHALRRHRASDTSTSKSKGLLYVGTGVSGGEEGALKGPSLMPGGSARRLADHQADLPGDRGQGRTQRRHSLLRMGRARAAPDTTSRWSTTASNTATCS